MSVYVDTPITYPAEPKNYIGRARVNARWCHMFADTQEELHCMAMRIGLRRAWFQPHPKLPHYDLVPSKRTDAIKLGAIAVTRRELAERLARQ